MEFTKQELQMIAQALSQAQTTVGQAKPVIALLEKVVKELEVLDKPQEK